MKVVLAIGTIDVQLERDTLVISGIPADWEVDSSDIQSGSFVQEGDTVRCCGVGAVEFWSNCGYDHVLWGEAGLWGPSPDGMVMLLQRPDDVPQT